MSVIQEGLWREVWGYHKEEKGGEAALAGLTVTSITQGLGRSF